MICTRQQATLFFPFRDLLSARGFIKAIDLAKDLKRIRGVFKSFYKKVRCLKQLRLLLVFIFTNILLLSFPRFSFSEPSIAMLWKARALEANSKLDIIRSKIENLRSKKLNAREEWETKCEAMMETAYAAHINLEKMVHQKGSDAEVFHLILNEGKESGVFDLIYQYRPDGSYSMTFINSIPKGWYVGFLKPDSISLYTEQCLFDFHIYKPFEGRLILVRID